VLGSVGAPDLGVLYFIEFDLTAREATLVVERNVAEVAAERRTSLHRSDAAT
jgi:hypothetical protein